MQVAVHPQARLPVEDQARQVAGVSVRQVEIGGRKRSRMRRVVRHDDRGTRVRRPELRVEPRDTGPVRRQRIAGANILVLPGDAASDSAVIVHAAGGGMRCGQRRVRVEPQIRPQRRPQEADTRDRRGVVDQQMDVSTRREAAATVDLVGHGEASWRQSHQKSWLPGT